MQEDYQRHLPRPPGRGPVLAAEILYKHDLEVEAVIPALIASIIGYSVFGAWSGWNPIFVTHGSLAFTSPPQLLYYVVLGLLCGLIGLLYARGFYGITAPPQVGETWHWWTARRPDRASLATGTGHGLRLGAGQHGTWPALASPVGDPGAAFRQDPDDRAFHWVRRFRRHLRSRYGHRGHGGRLCLAAVLPRLAGRA